MTAHVTDPRAVDVQRKVQAKRAGHPRAGRGQVAGQLVGDWDPAMRARIRADLLRFRWLSGQADGPEMEVVALIDQLEAGQ